MDSYWRVDIGYALAREVLEHGSRLGAVLGVHREDRNAVIVNEVVHEPGSAVQRALVVEPAPTHAASP